MELFTYMNTLCVELKMATEESSIISGQQVCLESLNLNLIKHAGLCIVNVRRHIKWKVAL